MRTILRDIGRGVYNLFIAITIVAFLGGTLALANYAVTQGSGTNFGSVVISSVHYAQQLLCDLTTPSQCAAVDSSGNLSVKSSTLSTAANQSLQITQETATATGVGAPADSAWTSGSGSIIALLKAAVNGINGAIAAGANVIGGVFGSPNVTQTDCSIALTTGGTAQNIITAGATLHGFRIMNIDTSAGSGEPVWMSFTTTAAASTIASYPLAAPTATTFAGAGSYSAEFGSGTNGNVSVVAATTGHKISCTKW
jgi:hypothetical protein